MMLPTRALSVMFLVGAFGLPEKTKSTALSRWDEGDEPVCSCSFVCKDKRNRHKKILRQALRTFHKERHDTKDTKAPSRHASWGDDDDPDNGDLYYWSYYDEDGNKYSCDERAEQFADSVWKWYP